MGKNVLSCVTFINKNIGYMLKKKKSILRVLKLSP